jgi:hypothetical protein
MSWIAAAAKLGNAFPMPRGGGWGSPGAPMARVGNGGMMLAKTPPGSASSMASYFNALSDPRSVVAARGPAANPATLGLPMLQDGGSVVPGQPVVVGEAGPEVIVPAAPATVVPSPYDRFGSFMAPSSTKIGDSLDSLKNYFVNLLKPKPAVAPLPATYGPQGSPQTPASLLGIKNPDVMGPEAQAAYARATGGNIAGKQLEVVPAMAANQRPQNTGLMGKAAPTQAQVDNLVRLLKSQNPDMPKAQLEAMARQMSAN